MFQGIVIGAVGGFVLGSIYGKYVLAEYSSLKDHISTEIGSIKAAIESELKKIKVI